MPFPRSGLALLLGAGSTLAATGASREVPAGNAAVRYDRDVRPILADRCFTCHGLDAKQRQAELRLDDPASALADRGGYAAIVPGQHAQSALWERLTAADPDERMPPASSHKRALSSAELELVRRWIDAGAQYEPHWSFVPPTRPPLPAVRDAAWPRDELDRFVLADLEARGVAPSPDAEPAQLCRRVFLDLTGLPPTPEELASFVADVRADAYEELVDRLLTEEPYRTRHAERLATPWLDGARYADTIGIHTDNGRSLWPWRDWVLGALRDNMPFDRFLTEQLAGDLLPDATLAQRVASGFNRSHVLTDEGGAIAAEYLVEYAVDRAATTSSVFLGLTLGCARCHDHKFDPLTQEDFYSFYSFFSSVDEPGLYDQRPDPRRAFEPFLAVPSAAQAAERTRLTGEIAELELERERPAPGEAEAFADFTRSIAPALGLTWAETSLVEARSSGGATLTPQPDGSLRAEGANPDQDEHVVTLRTAARGLRLLHVLGLPDPDKLGRYENGNVVLTGVELSWARPATPEARTPVPLAWAWADVEQQNGDYGVLNVLEAGDRFGWAVDGHQRGGPRQLLVLTEEPFGTGEELLVTVALSYRSEHARHVFRRTKLALATLDAAALDALPITASNAYRLGPFPSQTRLEPYTRDFGPEAHTRLDRGFNFGNGNQYWARVSNWEDGRPLVLPEGVNVSYTARVLHAPSARRLTLALGSDDGLVVYQAGREVFRREIDRGVLPDQDRVTVELRPGANTLVFKIVNTGGQAGFAYAAREGELALDPEVLAALLPAATRGSALDARLRAAWRTAISPEYRRLALAIGDRQRELAALEASIPATMVMKELATPRETHVLDRGRYDHPDKARPVARAVPAALGRLPDGAPRDRRGLAQWLVSPANPLVARVAANRTWETLFGAGIVRSSEDFGLQGEWPSHPELLDWLAVELRESGWDLRALVRRIATSRTYRQSSRAREDLAERDPDNRWLARFPRQRLGAEAIRDQALFVSGLLVERFGGPPVKTYEPAGLWEEVAMLASNTRSHAPGPGDEVWRRSLYTYWKRASPPSALFAFDAPTRESCTIRRSTTNTPLQALVLWNDEQFVEAARKLAERTLAGRGDESARLAELFQRCTARTPGGQELERLRATLERFRARYQAEPAAAERLLAVGRAPRAPELDAPELAAWTMVANAVLSLDATITRN